MSDIARAPELGLRSDAFKDLYAAVESAGLALCEMSFCLARGGEYVDANFLFKMASCLNTGATKGEGVEGLLASCEPVSKTLNAMAFAKALAGQKKDALIMLRVVDFLDAAIGKVKGEQS